MERLGKSKCCWDSQRLNCHPSDKLMIRRRHAPQKTFACNVQLFWMLPWQWVVESWNQNRSLNWTFKTSVVVLVLPNLGGGAWGLNVLSIHPYVEDAVQKLFWRSCLPRLLPFSASWGLCVMHYVRSGGGCWLAWEHSENRIFWSAEKCS